MPTDIAETLNLIPFEDVDPAHPVRIFHNHWRAEKDAHGVFCRRSFNPARFPKLLPWVILVVKEAVTADAPRQQDWAQDRDYRFRYRLCGTEYRQLVGRDVTGQTVGSLQTPEQAEISYLGLEACLDSNQALAAAVDMPLEGREFLKIIRAGFPMSSDGKTLDQVLMIVAPASTRVF